MFGNMADARIQKTVKKRLMVISAKGGVGKSTVTVNLAAGLIAAGYTAGIFDADVHGPNIPALLGISRKKDVTGPDPRTMVTIEARSNSPALQRATKPFERYGIKLTSLGLLVGDYQVIQPEGDVIGSIMTFMLRQVDWGGIDVLLMDMPPGTGEPLESLLDTGVIDGVLLVTTREQLAHLDNGRLLSLLRRKMIPVLGVVENMTHVICPNCGDEIPLYPAPVTEQAEIYRDTPVLASLPFHPELIRQVRGGAPMPISDPAHAASQAFIKLASTVMLALK